MDERGGDSAGWVVAAVTAGTAALGGLGALWSRVWRANSEREKTAIEQFRQLAGDLRAESERLRARLTLHDAHMEEQQTLIEDLFRRSLRCQRDSVELWERLKRAGVDVGPMPESLRDPPPPATGFVVRTLGQNTSLLRQMDAQSETVRRSAPAAATPTSAANTGSATVPPAPDPTAGDKAP